MLGRVHNCHFREYSQEGEEKDCTMSLGAWLQLSKIGILECSRLPCELSCIKVHGTRTECIQYSDLNIDGIYVLHRGILHMYS